MKTLHTLNNSDIFELPNSEDQFAVFDCFKNIVINLITGEKNTLDKYTRVKNLERQTKFPSVLLEYHYKNSPYIKFTTKQCNAALWLLDELKSSDETNHHYRLLAGRKSQIREQENNSYTKLLNLEHKTVKLAQENLDFAISNNNNITEEIVELRKAIESRNLFLKMI